MLTQYLVLVIKINLYYVKNPKYLIKIRTTFPLYLVLYFFTTKYPHFYLFIYFFQTLCTSYSMAFFSLYTEKERAVESLVAGLYVQWNMLPHKDGNSDHYTGEKQWKKFVKLISRKIKWTCLNNSEKKSWLWFHEKSSRTSCQYIRMEILAAMVQARLINMRKSPPVAASAGVILPRVHLGEVAWKNSLSRINSFGWKKWIFIKIMIAMKAILRYVHICKMFIFNLKNRILLFPDVNLQIS